MDQVELSKAVLRSTNFLRASLLRANLSGADLRQADLSKADLSEADLTGANLTYSSLVRSKIMGAKISGSKIYGVNVWDLRGEFAEQKELMITPQKEFIITVDNIKVAQFIYLLLNNKEIRDVVNTLTSKSVLILGRFAIPERKAILDAFKK